MSSRRPSKGLSHEDLDLWNKVSQLVKPLSRRRDVKTIPEYKISKSTQANTNIGKPETRATDDARTGARLPAKTIPITVGHRIHQPPRLDAQESRKLRRGRIAIDARIDLHGLSQAEAHEALVQFVTMSRAAGFARVLVITGKGKPDGTAEGRGVLRRMVPHWLTGSRLAASIVGFEEAGLRHGGSGSLYVRLKRG